MALSLLSVALLFFFFTSALSVVLHEFATSTFQFSLNSDYSFEVVSYDGALRFTSSPIAYSFYFNGQWKSISQNSLKVVETFNFAGDDVHGLFQAFVLKFVSDDNVPVDVQFSVYSDFIVFQTTYPDGAQNTNQIVSSGLNDYDFISSKFPSIQVNGSDRVGYLSYSGPFLKDQIIGEWTGKSAIQGGMAGGPVVFYNNVDDMSPSSTTAVFSPFANFMSSSFFQDSSDLSTISAGIMGSSVSIPAGHSFAFILSIQLNSGMKEGIKQWGKTLLDEYGKEQQAWRRDFTANYLGYNTDNGAYYYYKTEPNKDYQTTMLDVYSYANTNSIPYRWTLLDSWWYYKGYGDGVKNWTARPDIFPNGIDYLRKQTGWRWIAHNRYWSRDTDYSQLNGGEYYFLHDNVTGLAIPYEQRFWDDLIWDSVRQWGLDVYEQDWLWWTMLYVSQTRTDPVAARRWMVQMSRGCERHGVNFQLCMPYPRHVLQSVEMYAVTQSRASDDYQPGNDQWQDAVSSLVISALGLAPFKDNFWTTGVQPDNPYNKSEMAPALEAVVATLSTGPVTPGDRIGYSDVDLIMYSARTDGLLLKPDEALTPLDSLFQERAFSTGPKGEVYHTSTTFYDLVFHIVLTAQVPASYSLLPIELDILGGVDVPSVPYLVSSFTRINGVASFSTPQLFTSTSPLSLIACGKPDFHVYYFSPIFFNGYALMGEVNKWTAVSKQRIEEITQQNGNAKDEVVVRMIGEEGEKVAMRVAVPVGQKYQLQVVTCSIGASGKVILTLPALQCVVVP